MILDAYLGLAVGVLCVVLCTSRAGEYLRDRVNPLGVLDCHFCTSCWLALASSLAFRGEIQWYLRAGAIAAVANLAILVIHMSISTVSEPENELDS